MLNDLTQALASLELHLANVAKLAKAWNAEPPTSDDPIVGGAEHEVAHALHMAQLAGEHYSRELSAAIVAGQSLRRLKY